MSQPVNESQNYKNITSTTQIYPATNTPTPATCGLLGIFVAQASSTPTIQVLDGTAASSVTVVNTFTPVASTFYPLPFKVNNGLRIVISGTVDCTVAWSIA